MTAIALTESSVLNTKRALMLSLPNEKSSYLTESLAAACGYQTQAALLAAVKRGDPVDPDFVLLSDDAFVLRLYQLTGNAIHEKGNFPGFEQLPYPSRKDVISTWSKHLPKIGYASTRDRAWRNAMVAGINAGLAQRLFSVRPGDNRWRGATSADDHRRGETHIFRFALGDIPAIASVFDASWDELSIHVAFWPAPDGERWIGAFNADFRAGELFASGWLERRRGAWLQASSKPELSCRKSRLATVATLAVEPRGYADRGSFML